MKNRIRLILICLAALLLAGKFQFTASAQKAFSHTTAAHRAGKYSDCNVCHTLPTRNWTDRRADKEDTFPDVRSYPFNAPGTKKGKEHHNTCIGCHESDWYKPNFCLGCHTTRGTKSNKFNVRPFPNPSNGTQFITVFPHDVHQDLIAANERRRDIAVGHFVFASYIRPPDKKETEFYSCSVCHKTAAVAPKFENNEPSTVDKLSSTGSTYPFGRLRTETDNFKPAADFFKDVPQNHASCFTCHYQLTEPVSTNCNGCHIFADKRFTPSDTVGRSSLKFSHEQLGIERQKGERVHAKDECVKCHVRTASSSDLQALLTKKEPEVPFSSCTECHRTDINDQFEKRKNDKAFQCTYCHTSAIGRYVKPESHKQ